MMRQSYIKIIVIVGYVLLVSLAVFGIIWIYSELVKYSETNKPYEPRKELVIITNTLAVLYQAEGTVGLQTIAADPLLKQEYDSLMQTVFAQIDSLKKVSIDRELSIHVDSLNTLLLQKKKNTEELVRLMHDFETETVKEISRTTVLSKKDLDKLQNILQKNKTEVLEDTTVIVAEKKGFFKRIRDAIKSNQPDTLVQTSSLTRTNTEDVVLPTITDTIVDFIRDVNRVTQKRNASLALLVVQRQNELYRMNEQTISQINRIVDDIELYEYNHRLSLMVERESTLKRTSNMVSIIAYTALIIAIIFMSWIIYSISASQRLQREIEKAKKVVENLLISREQLLLTITHDIKAPISSIIGYLELMKRDKPCEKNSYYIENMQQSSVHILDLIKDLLDFYSLDHNQQKINLLPFSPFLLISNIFESFIPEADKKEIQFDLKTDIPNDENYVSDPYRIRQILNNLLSNAIKYTPEKGSVTLSSSLEIKKNKHTLILSVKDTGPGIKEKDKVKIFEEFHRLEYTGIGIEGLGLGLNISNKLTQLLGGIIEIDSTFGEGSVFMVRIPLQSNNEKEERTENQLQTDKNQSIDKNIKILFIDDDIVQLNLLEEVMKREGLTPYTCSNALYVLQLIQKERFDIIFSDIQMAGMNGFELVERIRSITFDSSSQIPIIGLSANSNIPESKFKEAGFSGFLPKPFTMEQLFEIIQSHTAHIRENKETYSSDGEGFIALTQFAGNDETAAKNILDSFIQENKKNLETLKTAFEAKDWETIAGVSHKMISLMKMISAQKLVSLLQEYENGSRSEENKLPLLSLIEEKIKEAELYNLNRKL
jgi:signal transduction histidine kinase/FixJ family two-component response regulator